MQPGSARAEAGGRCREVTWILGARPVREGRAVAGSWHSQIFAAGTQGQPQGTRGALAPFVDAKVRQSGKGWLTWGVRCRRTPG